MCVLILYTERMENPMYSQVSRTSDTDQQWCGEQLCANQTLLWCGREDRDDIFYTEISFITENYIHFDLHCLEKVC